LAVSHVLARDDEIERTCGDSESQHSFHDASHARSHTHASALTFAHASLLGV
jgi:hypothetical protein